MVLHFVVVVVVVVGSLPVAVAEFEVRSRAREEWVEDFFSAFGEHLQDRVKRGCPRPRSQASDLQVRGTCSRSRSTSFSWLRYLRKLQDDMLNARLCIYLHACHLKEVGSTSI